MKDLILIASELQHDFWERGLYPSKVFVQEKYDLNEDDYGQLLEVANLQF